MLIGIPRRAIWVNDVLMPAFWNDGFVKTAMFNVRMINTANTLILQNQSCSVSSGIIKLTRRDGQPQVNEWAVHKIQIHIQFFPAFTIALKIKRLIFANDFVCLRDFQDLMR